MSTKVWGMLSCTLAGSNILAMHALSVILALTAKCVDEHDVHLLISCTLVPARNRILIVLLCSERCGAELPCYYVQSAVVQNFR